MNNKKLFAASIFLFLFFLSTVTGLCAGDGKVTMEQWLKIINSGNAKKTPPPPAESAKDGDSDSTAPAGNRGIAVTIYWHMADDADVYLNGKPLRQYQPSFKTRPDEAPRPAFAAAATLRDGDVFTVGGRRGGSFGLMLIAVDAAGRIVFQTDRLSWKVYEPGDRADWYNPQVAVTSPTQAVTVQPDPWYPQKELNARFGNKAFSIWGAPANTFAYLYGVVGGERKTAGLAIDAAPPVKADSGTQRPEGDKSSSPGKAAPAKETVIASNLNAISLPAGFSSRMVVAETKAVLSSTPAMKTVLSGVAGENIDISQLPGNAADAPFLQGTAYIRATLGVRLQPPSGYEAGQSLGGTFYITLPLEEALVRGATSSNMGVICSTQFWTAFIPGIFDKQARTISVPTNHLSGWFPARQSKEQEMAAFFKRQGLLMAKRAEDWAKDKTGDILLEGVQEFLDKNDLDKTTAGKILNSLANNKESLQQIYEGVSSSDVAGAAQSTQILMGKILVENVPESRMAGLLADLTKHTDIAADASLAAGSFAGGDYYQASETIGRIIWKQSPIGKNIDRAIAVETAAWEFLTQNQYEAAYQKYKENGSEGLVRMFGGPAAYVREKFFQGREASDDMVAKKMEELFEAAKRQEEKANAEQAKLEKMYALFQKMEQEGTTSIVGDFRKRMGEYGKDGESAVFDEFMLLTRRIQRDLLALGVDPWELGRTFNSANPIFSRDALALLAAFARGGAQAYKAKLAEIAKDRFPKRQPSITVTRKSSTEVLKNINLWEAKATFVAHVAGVKNQGVTCRLVLDPKADKRYANTIAVEVKENEITLTRVGNEMGGYQAKLEITSVENRTLFLSIPIQVSLGCVVGETLVTMVDGKKVTIKSLQAGNRIAAYDEAKGNYAEAEIEVVFIHQDKKYKINQVKTKNGQELLVTGNHPMLTKGGLWKPVDELKPGDYVYTFNLQTKKMEETIIAVIIRDHSEHGVVYNLKTTQGNYIANDILIHNKCLKRGSLVETPSGSRAIESLAPGELVLGNVKGSKVPVRVTNVYSKETVLAEIPGKRLGSNLTATINHTLMQGAAWIKAGATDYPDEAVSGTVFDIRTESRNYYAGGMLLSGGD